MTENPVALLRLLQLFDSQFPVGAFAHSGGIETYAALGGSLTELRQVLHAQIELGWGRGDLAVACMAWHAAAPEIGTLTVSRALGALAIRADALKVVPIVRDASVKLGRRTLDLLRRLYPAIALEIERPHHALVVGAAARRLGVDAADLLLAYGQSLALGTLTAAVRCMPVSPAQAQTLLVEAHPRIAAAAERALADPEASLFTCTPALDIRSHQQARLHTRLFQS
jgi:urease accessory protein